MGAKILQSDDEQLKQEVLSGQKSICTGYKEHTKSSDVPINIISSGKFSTKSI